MNERGRMKSTVKEIISHAVSVLQQTKTIVLDVDFEINVERTKAMNHGDYTTNLALMLAKPCRQPPKQLARLFVQTFPPHPMIERVEIAGLGFINFFISSVVRAHVIASVLTEGPVFGLSEVDFSMTLSIVPAYLANPLHVHSIQYACARVNSLFRQIDSSHLRLNESLGLLHVHLLSRSHESSLLSLLCHYKEVVDTARALNHPHLIAYYLHQLANGLHSYYNAVPLLCEQAELRSARLCLLKAVGYVLHNGVRLLGVSALESVFDE